MSDSYKKYSILKIKGWFKDGYHRIVRRVTKNALKAGFEECMRVLEPFGTLIFKWNENQIKVSEILTAIGQEPLFGHKSGKLSNTHWMSFMKGVSCNDR